MASLGLDLFLEFKMVKMIVLCVLGCLHVHVCTYILHHNKKKRLWRQCDNAVEIRFRHIFNHIKMCANQMAPQLTA